MTSPQSSDESQEKILINRVYRLQQAYETNAKKAERSFFYLRIVILFLTTLAAVLSISYAPLGISDGRPGDQSSTKPGTDNPSKEDTFIQQISPVYRYCLIIIPIATNVLLIGSTKLDKGSNWLLLKNAAAVLESEMYYFRTKTGRYKILTDSSADPSANTTNNPSPDPPTASSANTTNNPSAGTKPGQPDKQLSNPSTILVEEVRKLQNIFVGTPVHKSCLIPSEDEIENELLDNLSNASSKTSEETDSNPPSTKSGDSTKGGPTSVDDTTQPKISKKSLNRSLNKPSKISEEANLISPSIEPEKYIKERLEKKFKNYRDEARILSTKLQAYRWIIYTLGGVSTLLASVNFQVWVAIPSTLTTAFSSYLELKRIETKLINHNQTADILYQIRLFWDTLSEQQKKDIKNIEKLVQDTETAIQSENNSLLQDMQSLLKQQPSSEQKTTS